MRKRFLSVLLVLCMVLALLPVSALAADDTASADGSYNDVAENYWGKEAIDRWSSLEIMQGTGSGNFEPEREMYRCEFATVLVRLMGYTDVGDVSFPDLPEDAWYTDAMLKLAAAGVMQGDGYNAMPMGVITREQVAVLLCRALGLKPTGEGELTFKDSDEVDSWAKDAMTALAERGMINGVGENTLAPLANITRASVAQLTSNMIAYYVTEDTVITDETVKGIVLVAGDAKVTLENTTTENPVVVAPKADSAEVVLAGTTKAEDINVAANNATVTVAETASASNVSVSGTEATIDVEGKVETVTVNEGGSNASVTVGEKAEVTTVAANGTAAKVDVAGKVETVAVGEQASNAAVNVAKGAEVTTVETDAAGTTVAVAGTVGTVAVGETAEKSNVSVAKGAAVTDVNTAAPETSVDVAGKVTNVTVADTAADTALTVEKNATVAKVETAADNVSVDGSGKVTNMTVTAGEGVTVSKDTTVTKVENQSDSTVAVGNKNVASGNTSSNRPSTGGTTTPSDPTPSVTYAVTLTEPEGGTLALPAGFDAAKVPEGKVTITATPNDGYVLSSFKVGEGDAAVEKVTTIAGGTQNIEIDVTADTTVTATFIQPLTKVEAFIIASNADYQRLPEAFRTADNSPNGEGWGNHETFPWLAIVTEKNAALGDTSRVGTINITHESGSNLVTKDNVPGWYNADNALNVAGSVFTAYTNVEPDYDPNEPADQLKIATSGNFTVTITYLGATYTVSNISYLAPGDTNKFIVKFMDGGELAQSTIVDKDSKVPAAPAATTDASKYFIGWFAEDGTEYNAETIVTTSLTYTAKYAEIKDLKPTSDSEITGITLSGDTVSVVAPGVQAYISEQGTISGEKLEYVLKLAPTVSSGTVAKATVNKTGAMTFTGADCEDVNEAIVTLPITVATKSGDTWTVPTSISDINYSIAWMDGSDNILVVTKTTITFTVDTTVPTIKVTVDDGTSDNPTAADKKPGDEVTLPASLTSTSTVYYDADGAWTIKIGTGEAETLDTTGGKYTVPYLPNGTAITITAPYFKIEEQSVEFRPNGPAEGETTSDVQADFNYAAAYNAAGITFNAETNKIELNNPELVKFVVENKDAPEEGSDATKHNQYLGIKQTVDKNLYIFVGLGFAVPESVKDTAANAVMVKGTAGNAPDFENEQDKASFTLGDDPSTHVIDGKCIKYFNMTGSFNNDENYVPIRRSTAEYVYYFKWTDANGKVVAVTKAEFSSGPADGTDATPKHKITFSGESVSIEAKTVDHGTTISTAITGVSDPTRAGYTFKGWSLDEKASAVLTDAEKAYKIGYDITLTAVWEQTQSQGGQSQSTPAQSDVTQGEQNNSQVTD